MSSSRTSRSPHAALTSSYAIALSVVAVLIVAANVFLDRQIESQRNTASIINLASKQSMLCQRIAWLADRYTGTGEAFAHQQLQSAITEMAVAADIIRTGRINVDTRVPQPVSVAKIYADQNLNEQIRVFINQARVVAFTQVAPGATAEGPTVDQAMVMVMSSAEGQLSTVLNTVALEYAKNSDERIAELQTRQRILLGVILLTIAAVGLFVVRPMTDKVAAYIDDVIESSRKSSAARRAAQQASAAKSAFLSNMSHELRTPMTGIMGICDLLLIGPLPQEQSRMTQMLRQSASTLLNLLNDILDLAKVEAGRLSLESIDFDLTALLTEVRDLFDPSMSEKGLLFKIEGAAEGVEAFRGDPKHIRQILNNLVGNAMKFTDIGSVTVRCWREPDGAGGVLLNFSVEDTGIGISEEGLTRLFRKFEQESTSTSRRYGGTGLGLAICKQFSEAMGGKIDVKSTKGLGSTFSFNVRVLPGDPTAIAAAAVATPVQAGNELAGHSLKILLAEDNLTTQFIVTRMLSLWGQNVVAVGDGRSVVARANHEKFDIILMDMQMPLLDGDEAAGQIRAGRGPCARVPIVALTADGILDHHQRYLDAGCDSVLTKPISWEALAREIKARLGVETLEVPTDTAPPAAVELVPGPQDNAAALDRKAFDLIQAALPRETFEELLRGYLLSLEKYKTQLDENVAAADHHQARRTAHAIKGSSAQFGAHEIVAITKWIEDESTDIEGVARTLPRLAEGIAQARAAILEIMPGANPSPRAD